MDKIFSLLYKSKMIIILALILVLITFESTTNKKESILKQNTVSVTKSDKFLVDLNTVPKKWDQLTGKNDG